MIGGFFATNIGSTMPFGMEGWRFAFHLMALVSLVTSALVFYIATDPRPTAKVCLCCVCVALLDHALASLHVCLCVGPERFGMTLYSLIAMSGHYPCLS